MPDEGTVADDDGGSPVGVGIETAIPAPEHRLALAVVRAPVSAARAGLGRALRWNGDGGNAEFGGFLAEEVADVADGRLGEAFVEVSFGGNVLARRGGGAASGGLHVDALQAFDGHHLGLGFHQDVADLAAQVLVAALGVTSCLFPVFGDGVASSFAITGLARDMTLVLAFSVAVTAAALMVGTMAGADGQVVLGATVSAEDVFGSLDVQFFERHGSWHGYLDVEAVVPAVERCPWAVIFDRNEAD